MTTEAAIPYWRLSLFYLVYFALLGAWLPYWPLYLQDLGFDAEGIGYLGGVMMATKIVAPSLWGWWSDQRGERISTIRFGALMALLIFSLALWRTEFWWLFAIIAGYSFFWNAILSQFDVVTLSHLAGQYHRYSLIRVWGSVGFIAAVAILGWAFDHLPVGYLPWLVLALLAGIWLSSLSISERPRPRQVHHQSGVLWRTLRRPVVMVFLLSCFLLQVSHGPYYTFFSLFVAQYGYSRVDAGLLWALGVVAEVVLFMGMHRVLLRFTLKQIAVVSLALSALRWYLTAYFTDSAGVLIFAQCLHAASFGGFHAYAVEMVRRLFGPDLQGQGMALYSGFSYGFGGAVGAVLSGWLWTLNPHWAFLMAAFACVVATLLTLAVSQKQMHDPQEVDAIVSGR